MMDFDFYKIGAVCPEIKIFDSYYNAHEIYKLILEAEKKHVQIIIFPELCLTGATCLDLFKQEDLINQAKKNFYWLRNNLIETDIVYIIGLPVKIKNKLFNCAAVCQKKNILGLVPKINLSETDKRYFSAGQKNFVMKINNFDDDDKANNNNFLFGDLDFYLSNKFLVKINFGNEICHYADLNLNLASKQIELDNNFDELIIKSGCIKNNSACVFINSGYGESSTDFVFDSSGFIYEREKKLAQTQNYLTKSQIIYNDLDLSLNNLAKNNFDINSEKKFDAFINLDIINLDLKFITREFNKNPFLDGLDKTKALEEILLIQRNAMITRFKKSNSKKIIIGVSGGLDSTLSLINAIFVFDYLNINRDNILAVTMPGFGTSNKTFSNAKILLESLGVMSKIIFIKDACEQHFKDINHDIKNFNITFENAQVRERAQILFDLANDFNGIVLGTGDLSEEALGFTTYNGDHISNYNPNSNLTKSLIRELVNFIIQKKYFSDKINSCLESILNTPVSPELLPVDENKNSSQHTEKIVGPYELNDFFIYYLLKYGFSRQKIIFMAQRAFDNYSSEQIKNYFDAFYKRFIKQQFKRSCCTDGPQIFSFGLSPRNSFLMPSDV